MFAGVDLLNHDLAVVVEDAGRALIRTLDPEAAAAATPHVETIAPARRQRKSNLEDEAAAKPEKKAATKKSAKPRRGRISYGSPSLSNHSRPIITEKGLGVKELYHTVVFEVAAGATKTEIKEAVQQIFKVSRRRRTANFIGKMRRRGQSVGYRKDWKKRT